MIGDMEWKDNDPQDDNFKLWKAAVLHILQQDVSHWDLSKGKRVKTFTKAGGAILREATPVPTLTPTPEASLQALGATEVKEQQIEYRKLKVVILEIGAGVNVPTVRFTSETLAKQLGDHCTLIRINPDFPLASHDVTRSLSKAGVTLISLQSRGLAAVREIDSCLSRSQTERNSA